jgi:hypothetical protein
VALASYVLGQKNVSRTKYSPVTVAEADFDGTGQRNTPLPTRRSVPTVKVLTVRVVLKNQRFDREGCQNKLRACAVIQLLEMGFAVITRVQSTKLHGPSAPRFRFMLGLSAIESPFQAALIFNCRLIDNTGFVDTVGEAG